MFMNRTAACLSPCVLPLSHPRLIAIGRYIVRENGRAAGRILSAALSESLAEDVQAAVATTGQRIHIVNASSESEFAEAFATFAELYADALIVGADPFFTSRANQLVMLASSYAIPAIYDFREFTVAGGLMSYGTSLTDAYRQCGEYSGRILRGENRVEHPGLKPFAGTGAEACGASD